jgi:hypothetical protein
VVRRLGEIAQRPRRGLSHLSALHESAAKGRRAVRCRAGREGNRPPDRRWNPAGSAGTPRRLTTDQARPVRSRVPAALARCRTGRRRPNPDQGMLSGSSDHTWSSTVGLPACEMWSPSAAHQHWSSGRVEREAGRRAAFAQERRGQDQVKSDLVVVLTQSCCIGYPASTGGAHRGHDSRAAGPATITGRTEIIEQKLRRAMIRPWPAAALGPSCDCSTPPMMAPSATGR